MQEVKPVENVILAMLFTYPGAIAYMVYYISTKDKTYYHELDSFSRAACCFFLSAAVTVFSFTVLSFSFDTSSLVFLVEKIKHTSFLWKYLLISFGISIAFGAAWHFLLLIYFKLLNAHRVRQHLSPFGHEQKVWQNLMQNYDITDCALIIRKNGEVVRAGMPEILPGDFDKDKRIVLSYCSEVEQEIAKEDGGLLGDRFVSVYDLGSNTELEFIASHDLDKAIREKYGTAGSKTE